MNQLPFDPIAEARQNWRERGWTGAADGMAAVTSITRVHQLLMARIDATLRPHGVSFARFEMLRLLAFAHGGRLPMSRARSVLQVHPASVTNVVDRLEADGLVRREAHPGDGRSVLLAITAEGVDLVERATLDLNRDVFEDLGMEPDEITQVTRVLAAVRERAGDFSADTPPEPL